MSQINPKLGKYRWYYLRALLEWADDLGRWVDLGHGRVWTTTISLGHTDQNTFIFKK